MIRRILDNKVLFGHNGSLFGLYLTFSSDAPQLSPRLFWGH